MTQQRFRPNIPAEDLTPKPSAAKPDAPVPSDPKTQTAQPNELGGPKGPDPTRYGDWERKGRCVDF